MSNVITAASQFSRKPDTQALAKQIRAIETAGRGGYSLGLTGKGTISSGCSVLDNALPGGGYSLGTIVEWVDDHQRGGERGGGGFGSGSLYLALTAARYAMQESNKYVVVIDSDESFYPPAALYMGLALERVIVLRPPSYDDAMWAIDQSLRSSAVAAVVARLDKLSDLNARRFQLAAEQNGALGLFLRPASARSQPSWSEVQWGICNHRVNRLPASQNTASRNTEPMALATGSPRIPISNAASKTISHNRGNPELAILEDRVKKSCSYSNDRIGARAPSSTEHEYEHEHENLGNEASRVSQSVTSKLALAALGRTRQIHLESLRMRGGRSGQHWMLMIDTQSGTITGRKLVERTVERNDVAASTSSMRLASQLAMPTSPRPANTSQSAKRNIAS